MSKRWNYLTVEIKRKSILVGGWEPRDVQDELNRQGQLGWELVNIVVASPGAPAMAVFKREA